MALAPTQRLNIIFIETAFDIFHHQACLSNLRISNHPDFDDDARRGSHREKCYERRHVQRDGRAYLFRSSPFSMFWEPEAVRGIFDDAGPDMTCAMAVEEL